MKFKKKLLLISILILVSHSQVHSQNIEMMIPKKENYGIDQKHKIIVWNFKIPDVPDSNSNMLNINFEGGRNGF